GWFVVLPTAWPPSSTLFPYPSLFRSVFQEIEYGAVVSSAPKLAPSILNCTPATPTLSAALAVIVTVAGTVWPFAGELMLTVGGGSSGGGALATVSVTGAERVVLAAAA